MSKIMRKQGIYLLAIVALGLASCKSEKRLTHYSDIYQQNTETIYIAPINDFSVRRAVRELEDSIYNTSLNTAVMQMYLTAAAPLTEHGYYVPGPLTAAQVAATETRTGKQLREGDIRDLHSQLGIDAVLFIDVIKWECTNCSWSVEAEYLLRSTHTGSNLMHVHVNATKMVFPDFKGNPKPLSEDIAFAKRYGCDIETAQRCRLVEILNQYVLRDIPSGFRARQHKAERYGKPHPDRFTLTIHRDGSVELFKDTEQ